MKTLYIADLDGTLLDSNAELSEYTRNTVNELISRGMYFSVATARTAATAKYIMHGVNLTIPMAMMSGVYYYDLQKDEYIDVKEIPISARNKMAEVIHKYSLPGFMYAYENARQIAYYENIDSKVSRDFYEERVRKYNKEFAKIDSFSDIFDKKVIYYSVSEHEDKLKSVYDEMREIDGIHVEFYRDVYNEGYWYLEAFNDTASKYNAVKALREKYGFDRIVGFGDNLVDISLFKACDEAYAVSNAKEDVKKYATGVIGSNTEDGVAKWLRENVKY